MAICRIVQFGEPILQQACAAVSSVDESVRNLIQNLKDTLDSTTGVGLAAPQIGVNQRVFIYDAGRADGPGNYKVLINPEITAREGETVSKREGCKSAPELRVDVERSKEIDVEGLDESGNRVRRHADGFESIVIQHETDHVNGKLITEQLSGDSRDSYGRRLANINRMQTDTRYTHNLEEIHKRLAPFASSAEGVLFSQNTAEYQILVIKAGTQIQLYFAEPASDAKEAGLSGIMSARRPRGTARLTGNLYPGHDVVAAVDAGTEERICAGLRGRAKSNGAAPLLSRAGCRIHRDRSNRRVTGAEVLRYCHQ
jgi:peptide deformylase